MFNNDDDKKQIKKPGFNAQAFKHAISMIESSGGKFLDNKNSSAAGKYHFLYNSIKNDPSMKGISKQEFMNRPELQESIMDKALNGELENYPYGESYANKLQERYNSKYNVNELSALVHFLGPNNTREFLKDPSSFNVPGKTNSTGQEYVNKFQGFFDQYNIDNQVAPEVQPAPVSQYGSPPPRRRREDYPTQPIDNTRVAMRKPMIDMSVPENPSQNIYDMDLNGTNAETEANINSFKQGGDLNSQNSAKDLVTIFEGGGSHKENPLGGIPQGTGSNGKPNLVEEGETKWNDYIFSNAYDMEGNYTGQDGSKSNVFEKGGNLVDPTDPPTKEETKGVLDYISNMDKESDMQAMADRANSQSIRPSDPEQSFGSKAIEVALNPMTAAGYAARNESLPDNFSRGPRNALDYAVDMINPAQYIQDAKSLVQGSATLDGAQFLEGAAGAIPFLPKGSTKAITNTVKKAGKYATTKTPLKNTYKLNPIAETLDNPNSSYRVAGFDAAEDFKKSGKLVSKNKNITQMKDEPGLSDLIKGRPTSFPSFQKGYADLGYLPKEGGVVFKTDLPTFKRGEMNPVTGNTIKGRHYAHRVIDSKGKAASSIPASDVTMYSGTPNWLMGHKASNSFEEGGSLSGSSCGGPGQPPCDENYYETIRNSRQGQVRKNEDGSESTHLMADNNKDKAFPTLFRNKDGSWDDFSNDHDAAFNRATKDNEVYSFGNQKDLFKFAREGSWKSNSFEEGGDLNPTDPTDPPTQQKDNTAVKGRNMLDLSNVKIAPNANAKGGLDSLENILADSDKAAKKKANTMSEYDYYNPKVEKDITSGDWKQDFLYNNQFLMDVPVVGGYIKDKIKDMAGKSGGSQQMSASYVNDASNWEENYTGASSNEGMPEGSSPALLDQYFSKEPLLQPATHKPKDGYYPFLKTYSARGKDWEKNVDVKGTNEWDRSSRELLNEQIDQLMLDEYYKSKMYEDGNGDVDSPIATKAMFDQFMKDKKTIYSRSDDSSSASQAMNADLGGHSIGIGYDEEAGYPYMSVADAWDFEPRGYTKKWGEGRGSDESNEETRQLSKIQSSLMHKAGNPYKLYDRFYINPSTRKYMSTAEMEALKLKSANSNTNSFANGGDLTEPDPKDPKKLSPMAPVAPKPADNNVLSFLDNEYLPKPKVEKKPLMVVDNLFGPMSEVNRMDEKRKKEYGEDNGFSYAKKIELGKERYKGEREKYVKYDNLVEENPKKGIKFNSLLKNANNIYTWNDETNTHDITPTGGDASNAFLEHYNHPITRQRLKEQIPGIDDEGIDNMLIKGLKAEKHYGGAPDGANAAYGRMGGKDQIFLRESHVENDATVLHESVHASKMDDPLGVELQKVLGSATEQERGPIGRDGGYNPMQTRKYLNKPGETYGNFAGFRQELGLKPGEQIDEKRMRQIIKDKKIHSNFSNTYDDDKIVKALNTIAYQENNNNKEYRLS